MSYSSKNTLCWPLISAHIFLFIVCNALIFIATVMIGHYSIETFVSLVMAQFLGMLFMFLFLQDWKRPNS